MNGPDVPETYPETKLKPLPANVAKPD